VLCYLNKDNCMKLKMQKKFKSSQPSSSGVENPVSSRSIHPMAGPTLSQQAQVPKKNAIKP